MKTPFFILAALIAGTVHLFAQESESPVRLIDTSVDLLIAGGGSSEDNEGIEGLQGGGHDPKRNGFTLQQAELALSGIIDPYFRGETHIIFIEDDVELEEAFFRTTHLPMGLEAKAGLYLTEFGLLNSTHPHTWPWIDQPIINGRFLGSDGIRGAGARLAWQPPTPIHSRFIMGLQNANHDTMTSFLGESAHHHGGDEHGHDEAPFEEGIAGLPVIRDDGDDLLASARWELVPLCSGALNGQIGFSAMTGPNTAGEDTRTTVFGADVLVEWRPHAHARSTLIWQTEIMKRDYETDPVSLSAGDDVLRYSGEDLDDWGIYSQVLWGFQPAWELGLRMEHATGKGEGLEARDEDSLRDDRLRVSPLLQYHPSEHSRVRVQYNYDEADHLVEDSAHTVWIGLDLLFGTHTDHDSHEPPSDHAHHEGCEGH